MSMFEYHNITITISITPSIPIQFPFPTPLSLSSHPLHQPSLEERVYINIYIYIYMCVCKFDPSPWGDKMPKKKKKKKPVEKKKKNTTQNHIPSFFSDQGEWKNEEQGKKTNNSRYNPTHGGHEVLSQGEEKRRKNSRSCHLSIPQTLCCCP
ncbi:hypothetical protein T440DRAFT_140675 [Plenodomus tracheiphilus IPT5]|uniref:Uncharacterized protein n=1 Tax=Plenodomus tracheiphilus IPT5 TaxID=1408161 RepID=A0A6A7B1S3_9PLEO|nr:hypothetical protein T440DRAFT_140675 [Plenodomus tracheiphilus IPT5]